MDIKKNVNEKLLYVDMIIFPSKNVYEKKEIYLFLQLKDFFFD
jgi:hypothetical protein